MSGKKAREERREQRLQKESEVDSQERRQRLIKAGSAAAFIAIAVVAVLIIVSQNQGSGGDTNLEGKSAVNKTLAGIPQSGMTLGDPKAKVTLIEFGDLQCPYCKAVSEDVIPELIDSKVRTGISKLDFRSFTIIGGESTPAGAAAIAAGEQGRGWYFVELFYRNQGEEASGYVTDDFLTSIAKGAGVPDIEKWDEARKSERVIREVEAQTAEAEELGMTGTPSFAITGPGAQGKEVLGTSNDAAILEEAIEDVS